MLRAASAAENGLSRTSPAVLVLITPPLSNPSTASPPPIHCPLGDSYRWLRLIRNLLDGLWRMGPELL